MTPAGCYWKRIKGSNAPVKMMAVKGQVGLYLDASRQMVFNLSICCHLFASVPFLVWSLKSEKFFSSKVFNL